MKVQVLTLHKEGHHRHSPWHLVLSGTLGLKPLHAPAAGGGLLSERLEPRAGLPPLLTNLADRPPEALQWLGASFGLTQGLLSFWSRAGYAPVYLRQSPSDVTGGLTWFSAVASFGK